jgi:glycosyltransferase involved in cell wall biosynthesis
VIPCYNEQDAVELTIDAIIAAIPTMTFEIIIVNDGSSDATADAITRVLAKYPLMVKSVAHDVNRGYGAALKTGIMAARTELIAITDADGTYPNERLHELVQECFDADMVVGARTGDKVDYSKLRALPKFFLRHWVSWLAGRAVPDINSGMRVFRKSVAEKYFRVLSDKFSFTITITLALMTNYHRVKFVPINYRQRIGKSKIKPIRDTWRFIILILRTGTYFAPVRAFSPIFGILFVFSVISLFFDIFVLRNLTDKTILLFLFSLNIAMFALLADMIDKRL